MKNEILYKKIWEMVSLSGKSTRGSSPASGMLGEQPPPAGAGRGFGGTAACLPCASLRCVYGWNESYTALHRAEGHLEVSAGLPSAPSLPSPCLAPGCLPIAVCQCFLHLMPGSFQLMGFGGIFYFPY